MKARWIFTSMGVAALAAATYACHDLVPQDRIDAQGEEVDGYPVGEFHRPGQDCLACHGEQSKSDVVFTVAGTIFAGPRNLTGVNQAEVQMTDAVGTTFIAHTNCVGNFFVKAEEWNPRFPVLVRVHKGTVAVQMNSQIGRQGSCASCHKRDKLTDEQLHDSVGRVQLFGGDEPMSTVTTSSTADAGATDCPVDASIPGTP